MNARHIAVIFGVLILVEGALILTDTGPNIWLVAALVGLVGAAVRFITAVDPYVARPAPAPRLSTGATAYPDLRTTALRQALSVGNADVRHTRRLRDQLIAIVDDELTSVHGIDRRTDPDAARAVLGEELDRFVSDERADTALTARGVTHIVSLIEQL